MATGSAACLRPTPSVCGRRPGTTPSSPHSTQTPALGGEACCGRTGPSGAKNSPSTGTASGWNRYGGRLTTCGTCQRPSARATPPRTTGSGAWNPTVPLPTSGPRLSTHPVTDKDRAAARHGSPGAHAPPLPPALGVRPPLGPRPGGSQIKGDPGDQAQGRGRQTPTPALPRAPGNSLFMVSSGLGTGDCTWGPQPGTLSLAASTARIWARPPNPDVGAPGRLSDSSVLQGLVAPGKPLASQGRAPCSPWAQDPHIQPHITQSTPIIQTVGGGLELALEYTKPQGSRQFRVLPLPQQG